MGSERTPEQRAEELVTLAIRTDCVCVEQYDGDVREGHRHPNGDCPEAPAIGTVTIGDFEAENLAEESEREARQLRSAISTAIRQAIEEERERTIEECAAILNGKVNVAALSMDRAAHSGDARVEALHAHALSSLTDALDRIRALREYDKGGKP